MPELPEPVVEEWAVGPPHASRRILVVRDDKLPGGSKRRVLPSLMAEWPEGEFVFGGPAQGYAQVALAYSAADAGKSATYFVASRGVLHPLTYEARCAGAKIVQVRTGRLNVVQARAKAYCEATGARFLPLGFDLPQFVERLAEIARKLPVAPSEVWCVAGSGALSRALQKAWPGRSHYAVRIGFPPQVGAASLCFAPEAFAAPAALPPPFPSCSLYDAKAWRFVVASARDGALFWNVAA